MVYIKKCTTAQYNLHWKQNVTETLGAIEMVVGWNWPFFHVYFGFKIGSGENFFYQRFILKVFWYLSSIIVMNLQGPLRSYIVRETSKGSAVSEIIQYWETDTYPVTFTWGLFIGLRLAGHMMIFNDKFIGQMNLYIKL